MATVAITTQDVTYSLGGTLPAGTEVELTGTVTEDSAGLHASAFIPAGGHDLWTHTDDGSARVAVPFGALPNDVAASLLPSEPEADDAAVPGHVVGAAITHALHQAWLPLEAIRERTCERLGLGPCALPVAVVEEALAALVAAGLVVCEPIAFEPTVARFHITSWKA